MLKIKINEGTFDEINYNTDENVYSMKKMYWKLFTTLTNKILKKTNI